MFYNILLTLGGPYLTEASPSICKENQWTGFYTIGTSVARVQAFLEGQMSKDKPTPLLAKKTLLVWQPVIFLTNGYLFPSSIYSLQ